MKLIKEWKMHIIRTVNQDRARTDLLENMKSNEALLERDWAMKFLPLQYRYDIKQKYIGITSLLNISVKIDGLK
jgi:hypothetical protein